MPKTAGYCFLGFIAMLCPLSNDMLVGCLDTLSCEESVPRCEARCRGGARTYHSIVDEHCVSSGPYTQALVGQIQLNTNGLPQD